MSLFKQITRAQVHRSFFRDKNDRLVFRAEVKDAEEKAKNSRAYQIAQEAMKKST